MVSAWQPGQLLFVGFPAGPPPKRLLDLIGQGRIGGVVLFRRNVESPTQLADLLRTLHGAAPAQVPLMVGIDQEGGRVQRLREPWTLWPPMERVADLNDLQVTENVYRAIGIELRDLGIELNFSPVADVGTRPDNPVLGDRVLGRTPAQVSAQLAAAIRGTHAAHVATCAKHFPGHGDTDLDSHFDLPSLPHDLERLRAIELPPFRAAIDAGVASLMTAHILFPALDPKRPATLSPDVLALLRDEMNYDGVIFTDDLEMKAVADHFSVQARTIGALEAGADALLICSQMDFWEEGLRLVEAAPDALVEASVARVHAMKQAWCRVQVSEIGKKTPPYPEHQHLAERLRG